MNHRFLPATKKRGLRQTTWIKLMYVLFPVSPATKGGLQGFSLKHSRSFRARTNYDEQNTGQELTDTQPLYRYVYSLFTKKGKRLPSLQQHASNWLKFCFILFLRNLHTLPRHRLEDYTINFLFF